jgi:prepilin-type N-terminal cleavage/methylation domain-containing protein
MSLVRQPVDRQGFTLLELLAVIATIGILAALLLPLLGKAKIRAQQTRCGSNLRQIGFAWVMYYTDNAGRLVESYPVKNTNAWVLGDMTIPEQANNLDLLRQGKLYNYNPNVDIYRCPADKGVRVGTKTLATVRSYSMNCFMGARDPNVLIPSDATLYIPFFAKDSELRRPSTLWVLLDEDERSINDGFFVADPSARVWIDFPANSSHRHNFSYALNFADGHSEVSRHRDPRTRQVSHNKTEQSGNLDLQKLARASTLLR